MPRIIIITFCLLIMFASCSGQQRNATKMNQNHKEFSLPVVPSSLQKPVDRANYLLMHYWDNFVFSDTLYTRNREFMEQTFVNYLSILPVVSVDSLPKGVEILMRQAEIDHICYLQLAEWAEKYLYDPNSPMLNESFYLPFLENFIHSTVFDETTRARYARQQDLCKKNSPGTVAADFAYITPDGIRCTLYQISAPLTLLFFYDPDCDNCHSMMNELKEHPQMVQLIKSNQLKVLAVYADGDPQAWVLGSAHIPSTWVNAYECEGKILKEETYSLRALPTLYLLDADKRVLLKDATIETLLNAVYKKN